MITLDGQSLTIDAVAAVARQAEQVELSPVSRARLALSHAWVDEIISSCGPVYGINTGFGIFSEQRIPTLDLQQLNRNLILSHAVATGPDLPEQVVRAAMLIRANTLAIGNSGVRPEIVETLLAMLNRGVVPVVPSQGSLGSSGDLAPLSHIALVFTRDAIDSESESGRAIYQGERMSGKAAMQAAGIPRLQLGPKEGLAVTNGATFSAALGALAVYDSAHLLNVAEISLAMSLEAMLGVSAAFDARLHALRRHPGQIAVAKRVLELTEHSTLIDSGGRIQDAYSLRCAPQVQGAARDTLNHVHGVISREINSVTDNPVLFGGCEAISGGNFHGEPVGMAMDFLSIAMAEVAAISERRIFRLTDGKLNSGLPPMLVDDRKNAGLNSGMMMPQYTAASLVLENQTLANPDSVHSLPTSAEQEDHNANSMTAARHTRQIIDNTAHVLAIEIYCAARGLDLRFIEYPEAAMGSGVRKAYAKIRSEIPYQPGDAWWGPELEQARTIILRQNFTDL